MRSLTWFDVPALGTDKPVSRDLNVSVNNHNNHNVTDVVKQLNAYIATFQVHILLDITNEPRFGETKEANNNRSIDRATIVISLELSQ